MVGTGHQHFGNFRDKNLLYVDKTELISKILEDESSVFLFTRPRRFGKSLNMSMLNDYFNPKYKGNRWFDGLRISEIRPNDPLKNSVPVIRMDLSSFVGHTYEKFLNNMGFACCRAYWEFPELRRSDAISDELKSVFSSIMNHTADEQTLIHSIADLCTMIHAHHGKMPMILVDEYDYPVNLLPKGEVLDCTLEFLRGFYSCTFKTNGDLFKGVLTGVLPIAKNSMFSGFNNATVDTVANVRFSDMFGFTEEEVEEVCREQDCIDRLPEIKEWYDGYRIGDSRIYNPWSLMKYLQYGCKTDCYWGSTADNSLVTGHGPTYEDLSVLASGGTVEFSTNSEIVFSDLGKGRDTTLSLLMHLGYLTAVERDGDICRATIPNREVRKVFYSNIMYGMDTSDRSRVEDICKAFTGGDGDSVRRILEEFLMKNHSVRVLGSEGAYQSFLLGILLNMQEDYRIRADIESGKGYPDILMESINGVLPNIIVETKQTKTASESLKDLAGKALEQVRDREYFHGLKGRTDIYGIAFRGKEVAVRTETVLRDR